MIKKFVDDYDEEWNEVEKIVCFHYNLLGIKNYARIKGKDTFFADYENASRIFGELIQKVKNAGNELSISEQAVLMVSEELTQFVSDFVSAFFVKRVDGKIVCNEESTEEIQNSLYWSQVASIGFFPDIMVEMSAGLTKVK